MSPEPSVASPFAEFVGNRRTGYSARQLLETDFPEPRWAVPGLLPEGLTFFAGAPKLGKSWLALNLAVSIACGGKALGSIDVEQGSVLYLALEDGPRRLKDRLRTVLKGDDAPEDLHFETEWPSISDGGGERLAENLHGIGNVRLCVVDVFARIRPQTSDRADRYLADYHAAQPLKAAADSCGVPVIAVHHTRKATADDFIESVSGTNGLAGAADTILVLRRSRSAADAELHVTGRDIEERKLALSFAAEVGTWTVQGDAAEFAMSATRREILNILRLAEIPLTPKEIYSAAPSISYDAVRQTVVRMAKDGQLVANGNGTYTNNVTSVTGVTGGSDGSDRSDVVSAEGDGRGLLTDRVRLAVERAGGSS